MNMFSVQYDDVKLWGLDLNVALSLAIQLFSKNCNVDVVCELTGECVMVLQVDEAPFISPSVKFIM